MLRILRLAALFFVCAVAVDARPDAVKVRVRVILVDQELNQKPVPFLVVSMKSGAKSVEVKTGLDGTAETQLPPGKYTVATPKAVELGGRRFSWSVPITLSGAQQNVDLTNDNAKSEEIPAPTSAPASGNSGGDLTGYFKRLKNTVVTVKSEAGHGTGFFVDSKGLVLTNQHVVGNSEYLAVQFDRERKIAARLIAADPQKDIALLWVNVTAFPNAIPAPLYRTAGGKAPVQEGERVFTIGSPLTLDKIITTGIVSKVETHTIMSDININPGNSGGPLFNGAGQVIGLTTFGTQGEGGPGVSGTVRIEEALTLLEQNRTKAVGTPPSATLLPVEPTTPYPVQGLKDALKADKFDPRPYYLAAGDFNIALSTPPFDYREQEERRLQAERTQKKRGSKSQQASENSADSDAPKEWEEEAGAHPAVLGIYVMPKAKEGFGSALGRSISMNSAAKLRFKTDFQSMKLFCGSKEVQPIHPGRVPVTVSVRNRAVKMDDSTYKGIYLFSPDAVNPDCGEVKLAIYSSKGEEPVIKALDEKSVQHIWADFEPFRRAEEEARSVEAKKR
ncbi:MAG: serine protease [Acidobacteria bacterium Pan2503]|uniref:Serine protease n=1 Tax=Candidatus Acidiferrum panamense TaxID=2741543 RepID=A0A7V8NNU2_9BACT|nr:serine protease [Candidatus Acidoferrum panamensis]